LNINDLLKKVSQDEKANVITHGFGLLLCILSAPPLLISVQSNIDYIGLVIFIAGMSFMFLCSTFYHLATDESNKNRWRIADHISIFVLIGCTYTPFILIYYNTDDGLFFLKIHWVIIAAGIIFKLIYKTKFEIISLVLYLALGWMVIFIYNDITRNMPLIVNYFLLAGGSFYTIGVIFYINTRLAWHHAIWHIFVILGCAGHYIALYLS
jgi:hemolysin III